MPLKLVMPCKKYLPSAREAVNEYKAQPSPFDLHMIKRMIEMREDDFDDYFIKATEHAKGVNLPPNHVAHTVFWLVDGNKYIGTFDLRHCLTEHLEQIGGHIGYEIRPSERQKGYAKAGLELCLQEARCLGIKRALVTCNVDNTVSAGVILSVMRRFGGSEINKKAVDGVIERRFWLLTEPQRKQPTVHLMVGFMGFGKTTIAKKLASDLPAVCLTHDEFMVKLFGRNMPYATFHENYKKVDKMLWALAEKIVAAGTDVIMDYGFWSPKEREAAYEKAKKLTDNVIFHVIECDIKVAKQRTLQRTSENDDELYISENEFDELAKRYVPWGAQDDYPVVFYNALTTRYIGNIVHVSIDRPMGSKHPTHGYEYPLNYGFLPYTESGDNEELDAYVLMINQPLLSYEGRCIGVVHRLDDDDDKLIVVPEAFDLDDESIEKEIDFQEKWFKHVLWRDNEAEETA